MTSSTSFSVDTLLYKGKPPKSSTSQIHQDSSPRNAIQPALFARTPLLPPPRNLFSETDGDKLLSRMLCCPICLTSGHYGQICPLTIPVSANRLPSPYPHHKPVFSLSPLHVTSPFPRTHHMTIPTRHFTGNGGHVMTPQRPSERGSPPESSSPSGEGTKKGQRSRSLNIYIYIVYCMAP